jgi:hypothetical protein
VDYVLGTKRITVKFGSKQYNDCFEIKFKMACGLDFEAEKRKRSLDELSIFDNYNEWYDKVTKAMDKKSSKRADRELGSAEYVENLCISTTRRPRPFQSQGYDDYGPGVDTKFNMESDWTCTVNGKPCEELLNERLREIK